MRAFYSKPEEENKRPKFLYILLDQEQADQIDLADKNNIRTRLHDHGTQVHLTTDGAFERYLDKRLETPKLVKILNTQVQIEEALEPLGFSLC